MSCMQSKLPDINSAIVRHRNAAMIAYDQKDFSKAAISFNSIISLLPDEYKVQINTDRYDELVQARHLIYCRYCETTSIDKEGKQPSEFNRNDIITYPLVLSNIDQLISGQSTMIVWKCPTCHETQPIEGAKQQTVKYEEPYYLGVIPHPPVRHGLHDRVGFEQRFKIWYDIVFGELEYKIGLYRAEYAAQNPETALTELKDFMKDDENSDER